MRSFSLVAALANLILLSACGEGGGTRPAIDAAPSSASEFKGAWTMSGTMTVQANGPNGVVNDTQPASGNAYVDEGANSDIVFMFPDCPLAANVNGDVATIERGESCTVPDGGATATLTVESGTATKTGSTVQFNASGNLSYVYGGYTYTGKWSWQYTMTKLTK
jgi:hypothetical protein